VRQKQNLFGAHPNANEMDLILSHLKTLKQNQSIKKPIYNAKSGKADTTKPFKPARFVIVEGEVSTYRPFRDQIDLSIFIDADWRTQLATRTGRDIEDRNYTPDKAIATFLQSNLREFTAHGAESKNWADVHLYCQSDYRLTIESVSRELFDSFKSVLKKHLHTIDLTGLIVPVLTPLGADDKIDQAMFIDHLHLLSEAGVKRILLNTETSESYALTSRQRKLLLSLACEYFPGLVLFCPSAQSLEETLTQTRWANDTGVDALWLKMPQATPDQTTGGIIEYLKQIQQAAQCPIILAGANKTILKKMGCAGAYDPAGKLIPKAETENLYIHENQNLAAAARRKGNIGFLAPCANVIPELFVRMEKTLNRKNHLLAKKYQKQITSVTTLASVNTAAKLKYALSKRLADYPTHVRLPLLAPDQHKLEDFTQSLKKIPYCIKHLRHKNNFSISSSVLPTNN
jgi:dihydrodipicolinate synthase/N-acetylneuraminate lyase/uridine kinase